MTTNASFQRRSQPPAVPYDPDAPAFERRPDGSVALRSVALARQLLRSGHTTRQSGFSAEAMDSRPDALRRPVLFQDGEEHREQRTAIATFFTPKAATERYRSSMELHADALLAQLSARGGGDLSRITMTLAVRVAAEVVGLTDSLDGRMDRRLASFFSLDPRPFAWRPRALASFLNSHARILWFYLRDVRPAIRARRAERRDDVISQLLDKGCSDADILIEAITFGAAGMVTTREFIAMAAWHMLEDESLRATYLAGDTAARQRLLSEVVRLEPVVGHLYRRVVTPVELEVDGRTERIEAGARVDIDVLSANLDASVVGERPACLRPDRKVVGKGVQASVLAFGDGHHRCPGSYLALEEADVFLTRFLRLPKVRIVRRPQVRFRALIEGYELRDFQVAVG